MRTFHLAKRKVNDFRVDFLNVDQSNRNPNDPRLAVIYHTLLPQGCPWAFYTFWSKEWLSNNLTDTVTPSCYNNSLSLVQLSQREKEKFLNGEIYCDRLFKILGMCFCLCTVFNSHDVSIIQKAQCTLAPLPQSLWKVLVSGTWRLVECPFFPKHSDMGSDPNGCPAFSFYTFSARNRGWQTLENFTSFALTFHFSSPTGTMCSGQTVTVAHRKKLQD